MTIFFALRMSIGKWGFHLGSVHGTPGQAGQVARIAGLESETWATLRLLPVQ
jgi:hypothetical protein